MPVYEEERTVSGGGSGFQLLGIFLIALLIIALALVLIFHAALHLF